MLSLAAAVCSSRLRRGRRARRGGTARARLELAAHSHATTAATLDASAASSWLDEREVAAFEYWPLELYKLTSRRRRPSSPGTIASSPAPRRASAARSPSTSPRAARTSSLADVDGDGLAETAPTLAPGRVARRPAT